MSSIRNITIVLLILLGFNLDFCFYEGAQDVPHIEISESEHSYRASDEDNTQSSEDKEEESDDEVEAVYYNVPNPKVFVSPTGANI